MRNPSAHRRLHLLLLAVVALLVPLLPTPAAAAGSSIGMAATSYVQGRTSALPVTYSTGQPSATNWVGIYPTDPAKGPGSGTASLAWAYAPNSSGTVTLAAGSLQPGSYLTYLLANDGYAPLAAPVLFTVTSSTVLDTQSSMLCVGQTSYAQGQAVVASYGTGRVAATNWIGIYPDNGQQPGGSPALAWAYAPNGTGSVSLATDALAPGAYLADYLYSGGYTALTRPARFSVTAPGTTGSANLIVNGDAECADASVSGYDGVTLPGWQAVGVPTAVAYGAPNGFPSTGTPGPGNRGNAFFSGGPVGSSTLSQTADVSAAADRIDAGGVTYNLSGWLGGYAVENSTATLTATFRGGSGASLGTTRIGPVSATDRGLTTALLQRTATGTLPAGTRSIAVALQLTRESSRTGTAYNDAYADNLSLTISAAVPAPALPAPVASQVPSLDHVFFVMLENRSYDQVIGSSTAPYLNQLANSGVTLTQSYGVVHPSDPNYLAVSGGSTFGRTDNPYPALTGALTSPHLGNLVEQAGRSWRGYVEDMKSPCNLSSSGNYDADNIPFVYFKDVTGDAARCQDKLQPITRLWSDLQSTATTPDFVWFEPNSCNTMHNCDVATGDTWMRTNLPKLFASPAWTQQRSVLVITFDEDDNNHGQRIPTIVTSSPGLTKPGYRSPAPYNHYSILRTVEQGLGLPGRLTQNDQFATPLNDIWN
ncbi:alkaline phosphatase family protein [Kitasatospora griseola]|uniref:alkaline phosphatase family protein n=1 Tax=Kitasatospora griseola TaxID=2064 RepID=UPI00365733F2